MPVRLGNRTYRVMKVSFCFRIHYKLQGICYFAQQLKKYRAPLHK